MLLGTCIEIKPELQRNILNFGYSINYKYEGMLAHSFDRFYVVTKFMLPMIGDLKCSKLNYDYTCAYMKKEYTPNTDSRKYLIVLSMIIVTFLYCRKSRLCREHRFSNVIKIMLFISDVQNYVPVKLSKNQVVFIYSKLKAH